MSEVKKKIEYKTYFLSILQKLLTRKYLVCNTNNKQTYRNLGLKYTFFYSTESSIRTLIVYHDKKVFLDTIYKYIYGNI